MTFDFVTHSTIMCVSMSMFVVIINGNDLRDQGSGVTETTLGDIVKCEVIFSY